MAYMNWSYRKGIHSSLLLLICWFVLCVCDGIRVASYIMDNIHKVSVSSAFLYKFSEFCLDRGWVGVIGHEA